MANNVDGFEKAYADFNAVKFAKDRLELQIVPRSVSGSQWYSLRFRNGAMSDEEADAILAMFATTPSLDVVKPLRIRPRVY